jgi:hypothetical protein
MKNPWAAPGIPKGVVSIERIPSAWAVLENLYFFKALSQMI